eukprot:scaffold4925_cov124-Skeletonema_marinoi.AAC.1
MPRSRSILSRLSRLLKLWGAESILLKARPTGGLIGWKLTEIEACKDTLKNVMKKIIIFVFGTIQHIFYLQPDAALNGLLNDAETPTEY